MAKKRSSRQAQPPATEEAGRPADARLRQAHPQAHESKSFSTQELGKQLGVPADLVEAQYELIAQLGLEEVWSDPYNYATEEVTLDRTNIEGVGIALKESAGRITPTPSIAVFVLEKASERRIGEGMIPAEISGFPTDVIQVEPASAFTYRYRERPAKCGSSIAIPYRGWGTIGCLCVRDGKPMILSNNHVLADENRANAGDAVVQPGEGRLPADWIGTLEDFIPLQFGNGTFPRNRIDAAIAWTNTDGYASPEHHHFRLDPEPVDAQLGMLVKKEGARTQDTLGYVRAVNVIRNNIRYSSGMAAFEHVIVVEGLGSSQFSQPGDSGSLVVSYSENRPVGLLFGGGGRETFLNPIRSVISALSIERLLDRI